MKNSIKTFALAIILVVCGKALQAQQQKFAYISPDSLILLMPEAKKADSAIMKTTAEYEQHLAKKETELQNLMDSLQRMISRNGGKEPTGDPIYMLVLSDYQEQSQSLYKKQQDAQAAINKLRQDLYQPIIEKLKKAIADVAKEKGYTYVLDATGILYSLPSDNIMEDVKKKLNIK